MKFLGGQEDLILWSPLLDFIKPKVVFFKGRRKFLGGPRGRRLDAGVSAWEISFTDFLQKTTKSSSESRHLRYFKIISKNYVLYHFPVALMHAHTNNYNFHSLSISKRIRKNGKVFRHRPATLRSEWLKWVTLSVEIDSCSRNSLNGFTWNCISRRFWFFSTF